ncbi:MAG TPA: hypothetical protein VH012_04165, partial [Acidimicrobiales bacterium]|nr:hypothetical protein [Acidimicrobiales bacterium]
MSVDTRTRPINGAGPADAASFFEGPWRDAAARHGSRAAEDAARLGLPPLTIRVEDAAWTLRPARDGIDVVPEAAGAGTSTSIDSGPAITLDSSAFADLFCERRTALGLVIGGRVEGDPTSNDVFCAWDPVFRSVLDGRGVYRPGDISLLARDGSRLDLGQRFRLGQAQDDAAQFLGGAGFLLLRDVFTQEEMDAVDADLRVAVEAARPGDGTSWWASTRSGEAYPCRILDFAQQSPALRALIAGE